jgi:hypothetical protein
MSVLLKLSPMLISGEYFQTHFYEATITLIQSQNMMLQGKSISLMNRDAKLSQENARKLNSKLH